MFKSKPDSLSRLHRRLIRPNRAPFSSPLKSGAIRSGLSAGLGAHTSRRDPFPPGPSPIPEASASLSTWRDSGNTHPRAVPSVCCVPRPGCNPLGCQETERGVIRDKRIAQGGDEERARRRKGAGAKRQPNVRLCGVSARETRLRRPEIIQRRP